MPDHSPRLFSSDAEIERIGEGLLERTLPRAEWTHEAHLAATSYLLLGRPDIDLDRELAGIIRGYNESVGGVNSDSEGYHETITRMFVHGVRLFLAEADSREPLHELVNNLLLSPMGGATGRCASTAPSGCSRPRRGAGSSAPTSLLCLEPGQPRRSAM